MIARRPSVLKNWPSAARWRVAKALALAMAALAASGGGEAWRSLPVGGGCGRAATVSRPFTGPGGGWEACGGDWRQREAAQLAAERCEAVGLALGYQKTTAKLRNESGLKHGSDAPCTAVSQHVKS